MEIHSTIQFRLILPHIPGFQQMPLPTPVCSHSLECNGCPYPATVFSVGARTGPACGHG